MPIFMDRHDVSDTTTAENVAQLHQEDLKIQHQFGCRGLTYWFDGQRKTAFCLIEATDKDAILRMHNVAHGQVPHRIIEVEPSIVESFLGRIEDPEKAKNTKLNIINDAAFRTIIVLQLKPLSLKEKNASLKSSLGDSLDVITGVVNKLEGNIVRQSEGRILVSFKSVTNAISTSFEIKSTLKKLFKNKIAYKIGVSAGVPVTEKPSIFEDSIRAAQRMCQVVEGDIIISSEVKDLYNSENVKTLQEGKGVRCITPPAESFLNALLDYAELNLKNTTLKIDDLGKSLGYSRSQLYRSMILLTGQSPNNFIKEYRLNEAFKLLSKNTMNISETAFETGFSNVSYFSKCFQKKYGYSPSSHSSH